jgi:uroporphyrinogen decarboxylase
VLCSCKRTSVDGQRIPRIVFTKGGGLWLEEMNRLRLRRAGPGLDREPGPGARRVGSRVALQGNLDPNVLFAPPEQFY